MKKILLKLSNLMCLILLSFALISCSGTLRISMTKKSDYKVHDPAVTEKQPDISIGSDDYSGAFVVTAGARSKYFLKLGSSSRVTYELKSLYPAKDVISEIMDKLSAKGWKPLKEDFMNPGVPTSYIIDWDVFIDSDHIPTTKVYTWTTDWKNNLNEVVRYKLSYEYPAGIDSIVNDLHVKAEYYPSSIVEKATKQRY